MLKNKNVRTTLPATPLQPAETSKQEPDGHRPRRATMDRSSLISDEPSLQRSSLPGSREGTPAIFGDNREHSPQRLAAYPEEPTTNPDEQWERHVDPSAHRRGRSGSTDRSPSTSLIREDGVTSDAGNSLVARPPFRPPTSNNNNNASSSNSISYNNTSSIFPADHSRTSDMPSYLRMADYTATSSTSGSSSHNNNNISGGGSVSGGYGGAARAAAQDLSAAGGQAQGAPSDAPSPPRPDPVFDDDTVPLAEPPVQSRTPPKNMPARDWRQNILDDFRSAPAPASPPAAKTAGTAVTYASPSRIMGGGPGMSAGAPALGGPRTAASPSSSAPTAAPTPTAAAAAATMATTTRPPPIPGWSAAVESPGGNAKQSGAIVTRAPFGSVDYPDAPSSPPPSPNSRSNASTPRSILRHRSQERERPAHKRNLRIKFAKEPRETSKDVFLVDQEDDDENFDEPSLRYDPSPEGDEDHWIATPNSSTDDEEEEEEEEEEDSVYSSVDDDDLVKRTPERQTTLPGVASLPHQHARTATAPPDEPPRRRRSGDRGERNGQQDEDEEDEATIDVSDRRRREARLAAAGRRPSAERTPERQDRVSPGRLQRGNGDDDVSEDVRTQPQKPVSRPAKKPTRDASSPPKASTSAGPHQSHQTDAQTPPKHDRRAAPQVEAAPQHNKKEKKTAAKTTTTPTKASPRHRRSSSSGGGSQNSAEDVDVDVEDPPTEAANKHSTTHARSPVAAQRKHTAAGPSSSPPASSRSSSLVTSTRSSASPSAHASRSRSRSHDDSNNNSRHSSDKSPKKTKKPVSKEPTRKDADSTKSPVKPHGRHHRQPDPEPLLTVVTPLASRGASPSVASSGGGSNSRLPLRRVASASPPGSASGTSTPRFHPPPAAKAKAAAAAAAASAKKPAKIERQPAHTAQEERRVHLTPVAQKKAKAPAPHEASPEKGREGRHAPKRSSGGRGATAPSDLPPGLQQPVYLEPTNGPVPLLPDDEESHNSSRHSSKGRSPHKSTKRARTTTKTDSAGAALTAEQRHQRQALADALAQSPDWHAAAAIQRPSLATASASGSSGNGGRSGEGTLSDGALSSIPTSAAHRSLDEGSTNSSGSHGRQRSGGGVRAEDLAEALADVMHDDKNSTDAPAAARAAAAPDDVPLKPGKVKRKKLVVVTRSKPRNADPTEADPIVRLSLLPFQERRASQLRLAAQSTPSHTPRLRSRSSSVVSGSSRALVVVAGSRGSSGSRSPTRAPPLETLYEHVRRTTPRASAITAGRRSSAHGTQGGSRSRSGSRGSHDTAVEEETRERERFRRALSVLSLRSARSQRSSSQPGSRRSSVHSRTPPRPSHATKTTRTTTTATTLTATPHQSRSRSGSVSHTSNSAQQQQQHTPTRTRTREEHAHTHSHATKPTNAAASSPAKTKTKHSPRKDAKVPKRSASVSSTPSKKGKRSAETSVESAKPKRERAGRRHSQSSQTTTHSRKSSRTRPHHTSTSRRSRSATKGTQTVEDAPQSATVAPPSMEEILRILNHPLLRSRETASGADDDAGNQALYDALQHASPDSDGYGAGPNTIGGGGGGAAAAGDALGDDEPQTTGPLFDRSPAGLTPIQIQQYPELAKRLRGTAPARAQQGTEAFAIKQKPSATSTPAPKSGATTPFPADGAANILYNEAGVPVMMVAAPVLRPEGNTMAPVAVPDVPSPAADELANVFMRPPVQSYARAQPPPPAQSYSIPALTMRGVSSTVPYNAAGTGEPLPCSAVQSYNYVNTDNAIPEHAPPLVVDDVDRLSKDWQDALRPSSHAKRGPLFPNTRMGVGATSRASSIAQSNAAGDAAAAAGNRGGNHKADFLLESAGLSPYARPQDVDVRGVAKPTRAADDDKDDFYGRYAHTPPRQPATRALLPLKNSGPDVWKDELATDPRYKALREAPSGDIVSLPGTDDDDDDKYEPVESAHDDDDDEENDVEEKEEEADAPTSPTTSSPSEPRSRERYAFAQNVSLSPLGASMCSESDDDKADGKGEHPRTTAQTERRRSTSGSDASASRPASAPRTPEKKQKPRTKAEDALEETRPPQESHDRKHHHRGDVADDKTGKDEKKKHKDKDKAAEEKQKKASKDKHKHKDDEQKQQPAESKSGTSRKESASASASLPVSDPPPSESSKKNTKSKQLPPPLLAYGVLTAEPEEVDSHHRHRSASTSKDKKHKDKKDKKDKKAKDSGRHDKATRSLSTPRSASSKSRKKDKKDDDGKKKKDKKDKKDKKSKTRSSSKSSSKKSSSRDPSRSGRDSIADAESSIEYQLERLRQKAAKKAKKAKEKEKKKEGKAKHDKKAKSTKDADQPRRSASRSLPPPPPSPPSQPSRRSSGGVWASDLGASHNSESLRRPRSVPASASGRSYVSHASTTPRSTYSSPRDYGSRVPVPSSWTARRRPYEDDRDRVRREPLSRSRPTTAEAAHGASSTLRARPSSVRSRDGRPSTSWSDYVRDAAAAAGSARDRTPSPLAPRTRDRGTSDTYSSRSLPQHRHVRDDARLDDLSTFDIDSVPRKGYFEDATVYPSSYVPRSGIREPVTTATSTSRRSTTARPSGGSWEAMKRSHSNGGSGPERFTPAASEDDGRYRRPSPYQPTRAAGYGDSVRRSSTPPSRYTQQQQRSAAAAANDDPNVVSTPPSSNRMPSSSTRYGPPEPSPRPPPPPPPPPAASTLASSNHTRGGSTLESGEETYVPTDAAALRSFANGMRSAAEGIRRYQ